MPRAEVAGSVGEQRAVAQHLQTDVRVRVTTDHLAVGGHVYESTAGPEEWELLAKADEVASVASVNAINSFFISRISCVI